MTDNNVSSNSSCIEKLILPIAVTIIAGVILLFLEYKTDIFSRRDPSPTDVIPIVSPTQNTNTVTKESTTPTASITVLSTQPTFAIEELVFCEIQDFDSVTGKCMDSKHVFSQGTTKIFISWKYKGNYSGAYSREWFTNGVPSKNPTRSNLPWGIDGQVDHTYINIQTGLQPGEYTLEFYLEANSQLIQRASFVVN